MKHLFIPDTQVKAGVPVDHLAACGNFIVDKQPDVIIHAGDHWDMPSLSSYESKGSKYFHDKSYMSDVTSGNHGMDLLLTPLRKYQARTKRNKKKQYNPRLVFLMGNHEYRIERAVREDPVLEGTLTYDHLNLDEWEVHPYLEIVEIDGILYSHHFINTQSAMKGVLSGSVDNRLNKIKQSFTQGHQQALMYGNQFTPTGREIKGLVAGAFYQHDEDYLGPQGNHYWRGVIMKHEVHDGRYDVMEVSLNFLLREYL